MKYLSVIITLAAGLCLGQAVWGQALSRGMRLEEIQNETPGFYVRISVNHPNLEYREGDLLEASVRTSEDGYLYLLYSDALKNVTLLFPNRFEPDNFIRKNTDVPIPAPEQNFRIRTSEPFGEEELLAVVSKTPLKAGQKIQMNRNATPMRRSDVQNFFKELVYDVNDTSLSESEWAEQCLRIRTFSASAPSPTPTPAPTPTPTPAPAPEPTPAAPNRFLVCVGVSQYEDSFIQPLPPCRKDVEEMVKFFQANGVRPENTITLVDELATMANVKDLFQEVLPQRTRPGDEVILFWSSHGNQCADVSGDEKDGKDETLVLYDSKRLDPDTQLLDDTFGRWMQNLDGRKILVILDACHSAGNAVTKGFGDSSWDFGFNEASCMKDLGQREMAIIASSTSSQPSLLRMENDMSVMTYFFLQTLKTRSGWTHSGLFREITPQVKSYVEQNYPGSHQDMEIQDDLSTPLQLN